MSERVINMKKIISIILTLIFLICMFSSCNDIESSNNDETTDNNISFIINLLKQHLIFYHKMNKKANFVLKIT